MKILSKNKKLWIKIELLLTRELYMPMKKSKRKLTKKTKILMVLAKQTMLGQ